MQLHASRAKIAVCVVFMFVNDCTLTVHAGHLRGSEEFRWSRIHRGHRDYRTNERYSGNKDFLSYVADSYSPILNTIYIHT